MKLKLIFLIVFGLHFVFFAGCGGSSSGGSSYLSIVGSWNETSFTGDGANLPTQLIFNVNSYGSSSGGVYATSLFYWTYYGITLSFYYSQQIGQHEITPFLVLTAPEVGTVESPLTLTTSTGGTATYTR